MQVDLREADIAIDDTGDDIEQRLSGLVDDLLDATESIQVLRYTATAFPALPANSSYRRSFRLRDASRKRRTGRLSGEWFIDESEADYGRFVVGSQSEQAAIHRGRWLSTEQVEAEIQEQGPALIEQEFN